MEQNTIAIIWDFDKTLVNGYMQEPIFKKYGINEPEFWNEVNSLEAQYAERQIRINKDTIYLNHMLTCVSQGIFEGLSNEMLKELGGELVFYNGVPEIFKELKERIEKVEKYKKFGIHVEHYIVSTGLTAMIKGSEINRYVDGIWGCEFIDDPIKSKLKGAKERQYQPGEIKQTGYIIDNTSKTRAIFEINKGVNEFDYIDVNSKMNEEDRRVPFYNMIYIADGPSDVPVFSVLQKNGGKTFAIYPRGNTKAFQQVDQLRNDGRIDMYAEADYSENTTAYMWLTEQTDKIAEAIYQRKEDQIKNSVSQPPQHITK